MKSEIFMEKYSKAVKIGETLRGPKEVVEIGKKKLQRRAKGVDYKEFGKGKCEKLSRENRRENNKVE